MSELSECCSSNPIQQKACGKTFYESNMKKSSNDLGTDAAPHSWPWMASLQYVEFNGHR